ncbi:MAG: hypothetical protein K2Y71_22740 [Xanthobacteraceae bacterium]|nr:hypothetical protein [Xanthobacteraceae bacterium]
MGFLTDIRAGRRAGAFGYAVFAWVVIGACIAVASAMLMPRFEDRIPIFAALGGLLGIGVGFYAEWGTSTFAKFLAVPGTILELIKRGFP